MRHILKDDSAISTIIGFALILAIIVTVMTFMQMRYVPVWNAEYESGHFEDVSEDMTQFIANIESAAISGIPRTSPVKLGLVYPKRGIFYNPKPALYGSLQANPDLNITINYTTTTSSQPITKTYRSTSLKYELPGDHPYLVYEHGIMIRDYSKFGRGNASGSSNRVIVEDDISIPLVMINGSGFSAVSIESEILSIYPVVFDSKKNYVEYLKYVNITLDTHYPEVWAHVFRYANTSKTNVSIEGNKVYINTSAGNQVVLPDDAVQVTQASRLYSGMVLVKTAAMLESYKGAGEETMGLGSVWRDLPEPNVTDQIILTNITTDSLMQNKLDNDVIMFKVTDMRSNYWYVLVEFNYEGGERICKITGKTKKGTSTHVDYNYDCSKNEAGRLFDSSTQIDLWSSSKWDSNSAGAYQNSNMTVPNSLMSIWTGENKIGGTGNQYIDETAIINYRLSVQ